MERTNFFLGLLLSFFSPKFYREVARSWRGRVYLALLIILVLFWIVLAIMGINFGLDKGRMSLNVVAPQMPVITIQNGVATTTDAKPTYIYFPGLKAPLAIIDTHNQVTDFKQVKAAIIVQQKKIYIRSKGRYKSHDMPKKYSGPFGPAELAKIGNHFLMLFVPAAMLFVALVGFGLSYIICLLVSLFLGLIGWIFAILFKREAGYSAIFHVSLMAWVPVLAINIILTCFSVYSFWPYLIFILIYIFYGVSMLPRKM